MKEIKINDIKSLAHTTWNCKYHIVFASKYSKLVTGHAHVLLARKFFKN